VKFKVNLNQAVIAIALGIFTWAATRKWWGFFMGFGFGAFCILAGWQRDEPERRKR